MPNKFWTKILKKKKKIVTENLKKKKKKVTEQAQKTKKPNINPKQNQPQLDF